MAPINFHKSERKTDRKNHLGIGEQMDNLPVSDTSVKDATSFFCYEQTNVPTSHNFLTYRKKIFLKKLKGHLNLFVTGEFLYSQS